MLEFPSVFQKPGLGIPGIDIARQNITEFAET
jgi:hypothetical protein